MAEIAQSVVCGPSNLEMGEPLAKMLNLPLCLARVERFPDQELHVQIVDDLTGQEVVLVQALPAGGESLMELALLADACRGGGARSLRAVLPYCAYARQDHRSGKGEALGGEVLARLVLAGGFETVFAVDVHSEAAAGWFSGRLVHLTAMKALAEVARPFLSPDAVVVSPDLGGAKRAERVASALGLPLAVVHKRRLSGEEVAVQRILGEVRGHSILLVDDLISTGGTVEAAVRALRAAGAGEEITVLATHALLVGKAVERLGAAQIRRLIHSDSLSSSQELPFERRVVPLAPLLAEAIRRSTSK